MTNWQSHNDHLMVLGHMPRFQKHRDHLVRIRPRRVQSFRTNIWLGQNHEMHFSIQYPQRLSNLITNGDSWYSANPMARTLLSYMDVVASWVIVPLETSASYKNYKPCFCTVWRRHILKTILHTITMGFNIQNEPMISHEGWIASWAPASKKTYF